MLLNVAVQRNNSFLLHMYVVVVAGRARTRLNPGLMTQQTKLRAST